MFSCPKGIDFRSLKTLQGDGIKDAMDKLELLAEVRTTEIMKINNNQFANVSLESSSKIKINTVVLLKNIANEGKNETMKMARVEEIKECGDGSQRVVVVTYNNVGMNKKGEWVGTPVTVERCIKDLVLVDEALDDSTLSPGVNPPAEKESSEISNTRNPDEIETPSNQTQRRPIEVMTKDVAKADKKNILATLNPDDGVLREFSTKEQDTPENQAIPAVVPVVGFKIH